MRRPLFAIAAFVATILAQASAADNPTPLGVMFLDTETSVELPFSNAGSAPIRVKRAEASCECLVPQFGETEIPSGQTKLLSFTYHPIKVGRFRVDIAYFDSSSGAAFRKESVTGFVIEKKSSLSSEQLRERIERNAVMVDLRQPDRFNAAHLPRSLNIPAFALRLHSELKGKEVVLVDAGLAPAVLAEEVVRLRENGFQNVSFFADGIPSWIRRGGEIEGDSKLAVKAATISAADYVRSLKTDEWMKTDLTSTNGSIGKEILNTDAKSGVANRVLVIAASDADYAYFEHQQATQSGQPIFYLEGGAKALAQFQLDQERMASNPGQVFQTKSVQPHVAANSGCGTCPKRQ